MAISRICNICLNQDHVQNICTNEKKPLLNTLVSLTKNTELNTRKNVYVCRKCNHDIENYKRLRQLCSKNLFELPQLYFQLKSDISDDDIDTEVIVTDFLKQRLPKSSTSGLLHLNIGTEDECVLINNESSNVNVIKIINLFECDEVLNTENVEDNIESNEDNFTNISSEASTSSQNTFNLPMRRDSFIEKKHRSTSSKCPHEPSLLLYKCYVCGQRFNMRRNLRIHHEEHEQKDFKLHDIRQPNNLMEEIPTTYSSSSLENTNSVPAAEKETTSGENHENQNILNDENITCGRHNIKVQTMNCIYQESSGEESENELYQNENNLNMEISENNGYVNGISKIKDVRKNICESDLQEINVCSTEYSIGEHENENLTAINIKEFESHETRSRISRSSVNSELENEVQQNENVTNKLTRCKRRLRSTVESSDQEICAELDEEVQNHRKSHRCKRRLLSTVDGNQINDSQKQITMELQNNPNNRKRILRSQSTVDRNDQYNFDEESRKESQEYKNITKRHLRSSLSQNFDGEFKNEHNLNENIQNDEVRKKVVSEKRRISLFKQINEGFENELQQNKILQEDEVTKKIISGRKTPCLPLVVDLNHINNTSKEIQNKINHNESTSNDNVRKKVTSEKLTQHLRSTADCDLLSDFSEEIQNEFTQNRNISNNEVRKEVTDEKRTLATLCTVDLNHLNFDEDFENELRQNVNVQQKKVRAEKRTPCLRSIDHKQVSDFDGELQQSENIRANNNVRKKVIDGRRTPRLRCIVDHNDSDEEFKNEFQQNDNISPNKEANEIPANNNVRKRTINGRRIPSLRFLNKKHNSDEYIPNDKVRKTVQNVRYKRISRSSLDFNVLNNATKRRSKRDRSCVNYNEIDDFRKVNLKNSPKEKLLFRKKSGCKDLEVTGAGSSISEKTRRFSENGTTFQCLYCPKLCKSIHYVLLHQRKHFKTDNEQNTLSKIRKTKKGVRLQCVHCPKVCTSRNTLSAHQIIHSPEYAILKGDLKRHSCLKACHVCGKQVRAMHLHLRVHKSLDNPEKNPPQQSQAFSTNVKKNVHKRGTSTPYSYSETNRIHSLKSCDICGKEVRMMHLHKRIHKKSIESSVLNEQEIKQASEKSNYCESDTNLKTSETKSDAEAAATKINED